MDAKSVMYYGHRTVAEAVQGLPHEDWLTPNVCGFWSTKDIIAHLTSFEHTLLDVLNSVINPNAETPTLERFTANPQRFNDEEVPRRADLSVTEVWNEYEQAHQRALALLTEIPLATQRVQGILTWYGPGYDLEDFIAYSFYGHKREHRAQIAVFRDGLGR